MSNGPPAPEHLWRVGDTACLAGYAAEKGAVIAVCITAVQPLGEEFLARVSDRGTRAYLVRWSGLDQSGMTEVSYERLCFGCELCTHEEACTFQKGYFFTQELRLNVEHALATERVRHAALKAAEQQTRGTAS